MKKMFFVHERIKESPDGLLHTLAVEENFQQFSTVQNPPMLNPATVASATTIALTTGLTFVTGTVNIATITPPITGGAVMVGIVFTTTTPPQFLTTGNIAVGNTTMIQNKLQILWFDPATAKWYINNQ